MVSFQLTDENPLVFVFPALVSPSSHCPLYLVLSIQIYSSLKTPAKSYSNCGFVETWHPVTVRSDYSNSRAHLGPAPRASGQRPTVPTMKGKEPWGCLPSRGRETETLPWDLSHTRVTGRWGGTHASTNKHVESASSSF